jgi:hypothetical protein
MPQIIQTGLTGQIAFADRIPHTGQVVGIVQAFGNYPAQGDEGYDANNTGAYPFSGYYDVSAGQSVRFDVAQAAHAQIAVNIFVP